MDPSAIPVRDDAPAPNLEKLRAALPPELRTLPPEELPRIHEALAAPDEPGEPLDWDSLEARLAEGE